MSFQRIGSPERRVDRPGTGPELVTELRFGDHGKTFRATRVFENMSRRKNQCATRVVFD
ncbi:MAG: hypothetical protein WD448_03165 [Woeseia sp.]